MQHLRDDAGEVLQGLRSYAVGLSPAILLTIVSFTVARTPLVWQPGIPIALFVPAIAQMGVHIVFFLHITSDPDNTSNVMALAFGVLVILLLTGGSVWIMGHMNHTMMPRDRACRCSGRASSRLFPNTMNLEADHGRYC